MNIEDKRRELKTLLREATRIQKVWRNREMPPATYEEYAAKVDKAERLSREIKSWEREIPYTPLPAGRVDDPERRTGMRTKTGETPGEAFTKSDVYNILKSDGWPRASSPKIQVPSFATKAIPTISASNATTFSVIEPGRDADRVRSNEFERLTLRDVVSVSSASSDNIQFVRIVSDKPATAETVAEGALKPESTMELDVASVPIRVLAVHMPVTEQQLEDVDQMRQLIDDDLRFDISRLEEYQMVWGDGTGTDLLGIMETPNVNEFTRTLDLGAGATVTLLDEIRGAISDIVVDGHMADTVALHPYDAEILSTSKGSDDHYLNQVFPTMAGGLRLWSLQVIETLAMENYRSGLSANQRVVLVGDYRRGATLYDRHRTTVEVGYVGDQFIHNIRTIRAESRVGFAVKRPSAFKYIETVAAGT